MYQYQAISETLKQELFSLLGESYFLQTSEALSSYGQDHTEDLKFSPELVCIPQTVEQIQKLLIWANQKRVAITTRGAGTGLAGAALPVRGGIVLSMEKFNRILNIDPDNLQITVESGLITEAINQAVQPLGLFYPAETASKGSCYIGGNVATNAGGARAVKYGLTRDYVLNMEVILPNGEIIWTGANTLKNSTAYNLNQLIVGSEGTLGIVTKIVLKLVALPAFRLLMLAEFADLQKASQAVSALFRAGLNPSALELMERRAVEIAADYLQKKPILLYPSSQAHLLIEIDGQHIESLRADSERIYQLLEQFEVGEVLLADSSEQQNELWALRRCIGHAVKTNSIYKEEDTVVPRAQLPALIQFIKKIGDRDGFETVCYGHAGDGNLHVNILKGQLSEQFWNEGIKKSIAEIFAYTKSLGGTISGEHGIGWVQRDYLPIVFPPHHLDLLRAIKQVFDPNGVLNPDKIFPSRG